MKINRSKEWWMNRADNEGDSLVSAGLGDLIWSPGPPCRGCGRPLYLRNIRVADGCPCNGPRGLNHGIVPVLTCTCGVCDPAKTGSTRQPLDDPSPPAQPEPTKAQQVNYTETQVQRDFFPPIPGHATSENGDCAQWCPGCSWRRSRNLSPDWEQLPAPAPAPGVGEGRELTFAEACKELDNEEAIEVCFDSGSDWTPVAADFGGKWSWNMLARWATYRFRRRTEPLPAPAPRVSRVAEMAREDLHGEWAPDTLAERVVKAVAEFVRDQGDKPALARAIAREFLEPRK